MRMHEVQKLARQLGIRPYRMKKVDLIRAIQEAEKNIPCYGTERVSVCGEHGCLWRKDCADQG